MAAVWYRFRAELRTRWRSVSRSRWSWAWPAGDARRGSRRATHRLCVLASGRGDRRLGRAREPRQWKLERTAFGRASRLPMVEAAARVNGVVVAPADIRGADAFGRFGVVLAPESGAGSKLGRPKILDGRMPDPRRATEVLVNPVLAKQARARGRTAARRRARTLGVDRAFANNLGTVSEPVVPVALLLVSVPVVLVLLNLVAYVPGRIAARTRPATVLRSE